ncbi:E3 ubiquitin-protein ligase PUB23-like [Magnolia sinica]|uniref:E3 ubiquitin-protein ligase PUB23-like n=1 Tax=Magnolia sinica TaxID=86752 RepID=UPI0026584BE3|nr:E3 ubiquitin-protein ligase PUB23-like [Magnolia sinica]
MEDIDIPRYFLCPISLEIMRDPVTLCTGITYDRESIERWIFSSKNMTCPVTKQPLPDTEVTPNHTLRRLIQAWCTINAANGIERIPTPKPPVDKTQIAKLLNEVQIPQSQLNSLQKLKSLISESERNKRCIESAGAATVLAAIINNSSPLIEESFDDFIDSARASDEALTILHHLQISDEALQHLITRNSDFIGSLTRVLQKGNYQSRAYATLLLKSIFEVVDPVHLISLKGDIFKEIVQVLQDQISYQATKASLQILVQLCPWGRNRVKASEAGAVPALVEHIIENSERRACEMALAVLDKLCACAEGRAELLNHSAGIAIVSKKILRVSNFASEKGLRILSSIARFSATPNVLQEMLQVGVVYKLCLVVQGDSTVKAKDKAKEILILHSRAWKNSPCIPHHFISSYPCK